MDAQQEYEQIPGISVAIVHDQELIWSAGFGYADLESQRPVGPATIYSICSISKLFTSVAAMKLRDEGKIRLDDRVDAFLPWFKLKGAHSDVGGGNGNESLGNIALLWMIGRTILTEFPLDMPSLVIDPSAPIRQASAHFKQKQRRLLRRDTFHYSIPNETLAPLLNFPLSEAFREGTQPKDD